MPPAVADTLASCEFLWKFLGWGAQRAFSCWSSAHSKLLCLFSTFPQQNDGFERLLMWTAEESNESPIAPLTRNERLIAWCSSRIYEQCLICRSLVCKQIWAWRQEKGSSQMLALFECASLGSCFAEALGETVLSFRLFLMFCNFILLIHEAPTLLSEIIAQKKLIGFLKY